MSYSELLPYGAPGFTAFALCSLPMGILADRWGRDQMMVVFFIGIGLSSILTGCAQTPMQLGAGLLLIGIFGSIYHPVGLAIVTARWKHTGMRLAVNGVWGNLGVGARISYRLNDRYSRMACGIFYSGLNLYPLHFLIYEFRVL